MTSNSPAKEQPRLLQIYLKPDAFLHEYNSIYIYIYIFAENSTLTAELKPIKNISSQTLEEN